MSEVRLTSWDRLPSGAALVDDAVSVVSDDVSCIPRGVSEPEWAQQIFVSEAGLARALLLCSGPVSGRVSVLRRVVLDGPPLDGPPDKPCFQVCQCRVATQHGA